MFRNIVSRLSFSPALVGQLSFYAGRLRKEQATRRLGLLFTALALVVQSLVVFQAPEAANAASSNDMVYGGLGAGSNRSLANFMVPYDNNTNNLRDQMNAFGITREEIANTQYGTFKPTGYYSWGNEARSFDAGSMPIKNADRTIVGTLHGRPMLKMYKSTTNIMAYIGHSQRVGWFAIMIACGNLVTTHIPDPIPDPPKPETKPEPKPDPGHLVLSKAARNITQGNLDATKQVARADDRITYTLTVKNDGGSPIETNFSDHLGDVLEYSTLVDNGGGTFDKEASTLSWPATTLDANKSESRTYTVKLLSSTPATPVGISDRTSYDCVMDNVFGNGVSIPVSCAPPKVVEQVVEELPQTGPTENMVFAGVLLAVVTFFYYRSKQMNKEVRLIRRDLNAGAL